MKTFNYLIIALFALAIAGGFQTIAAQQKVPNALITQLIKDDKAVRDKMKEENLTTKQIAALINDVKKMDLNGDGTPEIILSGIICGTANCSAWIYRQKGNDYQKIPFDASTIDFKVLPKKTNGYSDLEIEGHDSAAASVIRIYKYDGKGYVVNQCFDKSYEAVNKRTGRTTILKIPKVTKIRCN